MSERPRTPGGFTLIEIIAVLVLLGILAALAVPRFIGMQDQGRVRSLESLVATGQTHISMEYARQLFLTNGNESSAWNLIPADICDGVSQSGWLETATLTCTRTNDHYLIEAGHPSASEDATGKFTRPRQ